uniref:Uncharacterized protein n=4 Tax=Homalodisca liturata TaxID=320908 RepID=A0A1B6JUM6_9HEMI
MLSGELSTVTVRLENCGNLAVTRLLVTCGTPGLVALGSPQRGDVMEVALPVGLAPGASVSVDMQVRAHDLRGSYTADLLFYYENTRDQAKPLYRLVRHSWPILVHDSVQVSVTSSRSTGSSKIEETLNLRVQVQNSSQVHDSVKCEMCVECAALHSPHWQLSDRSFHPAAVPLGPQELAHFLLKVRRKGGVGTELSRLPLIDNSALMPSPEFLLPFDDQTSDFSGAEIRTMESVVALQATFIVMWRATIDTRGGDKRVAVGQHHVKLSHLGDMSSWPPSPAHSQGSPSPATPLRIFGVDCAQETPTDSLTVRQQLVTFSVSRPPASTTPHDFTKDRLCIVPVDLHLRNCSDCELLVKVEATGATVGKKGYMYSPHPCHSFHWVGCTRRLVSLPPHRPLCVKMAVAVGLPGAYNLGSHLTVQARRPVDVDFVTQSWRTDAILIVT